MIVGAFGPVVFSVSADVVRAFRSGSRERGAVFASHEVIGHPARLEPLTAELDRVSLQVELDQARGTIPTVELFALKELMDRQMPWPLVLGPFPMGEYVLTNIEEEWRRFSRVGVLISAAVKMSLLQDSDGVWTARASRAIT